MTFLLTITVKLIPMKKLKKKTAKVTAAIIRASLAILNFFTLFINVPILAGWYITGLLVFHSMAEFSSESYANPIWDRIYYVWNKAIPVMIFTILHDLTPYKKLIRPIFFYSLIAFIWEIISWITGTSWNDNPITTVLFLTMVFVVVYLTYKQLSRECSNLKQRSS